MGFADHVGSLLRPNDLKEARARREAGRISAAELRVLEDEAIRRNIAEQEKIGLHSVTDGELRRAYWHYDFLAGLKGIEMIPLDGDATRTAAFGMKHRLAITDRIEWQDGHPFIEDFKFLSANTKGLARLTIPAPSIMHFRFGRLALESGIYKDHDTLIADLIRAYSKAVVAFANAGCRFLQFDEVNLAMICDPQQVASARERGVWREDLAEIYADMIDQAIGSRPQGMRFGMHLCRGNFKSTWAASGGYEPIAKSLLNDIGVDTYFMEFDSDRAGGFEPLRHLPPGKTVVLGLITTKTGEIERKSEVMRRLEQAARYAPIEQLAISPQCGFASTEEGNAIHEAEQWQKLRLCVEIAREVWP